MTRIIHHASLLLATLLLSATLGAATANDPQQLVRAMADDVLSEVVARRDELAADTAALYRLVEERVIPHLDFRLITQLAVGRYWRRADAAQQERLTEEFKNLLMRTYTTALLSYSDQRLEYPPYTLEPDATQTSVPVKVFQADAPPVTVLYRMHRRNGPWQVYDVVIDNISLVTNYRSDFSRRIQQTGVDGLIAQLAAKNAEGTTTGE